MVKISSLLVSHPVLTADQIAEASRYLAVTRDTLVESAGRLSAAQSNFKPAPNHWSTAEIVEHVALIENRVHVIIERMSDAPAAAPDWEQAQVDAFILAEVPQRALKVAAPPPVCPCHGWSTPEAIDRFLENREETTSLLSSSSLRGHVVAHPIFGSWDGSQWIRSPTST